MKNSLLKISAVALTFISVCSCKSWSAVSDNGNVVCSDYHYDQISTLNAQLVLDMKERYRDNQLKSIENDITFKDSQSDAQPFYKNMGKRL